MTPQEAAETLTNIVRTLESGWEFREVKETRFSLHAPEGHPFRNWGSKGLMFLQFADGTRVYYPDNLKDMLQARALSREAPE